VAFRGVQSQTQNFAQKDPPSLVPRERRDDCLMSGLIGVRMGGGGGAMIKPRGEEVQSRSTGSSVSKGPLSGLVIRSLNRLERVPRVSQSVSIQEKDERPQFPGSRPFLVKRRGTRIHSVSKGKKKEALSRQGKKENGPGFLNWVSSAVAD